MNHKKNHKMKRYITIIILVTGIFSHSILAAPSQANPENSKDKIENDLLKVEKEMVLGLEDWMISGSGVITDQVFESSFILEAWMLEIENHSVPSAAEEVIELEPWMETYTGLVLDKDIELESWMFVSHR